MFTSSKINVYHNGTVNISNINGSSVSIHHDGTVNITTTNDKIIINGQKFNPTLNFCCDSDIEDITDQNFDKTVSIIANTAIYSFTFIVITGMICNIIENSK